MKKYMSPDMKVMAFMAEEEISANVSREAAKNGDGPSNLYNDAQFGAW